MAHLFDIVGPDYFTVCAIRRCHLLAAGALLVY